MRHKLPNRRANRLCNFTFDGRSFTICAGLDPDGPPVQEIFGYPVRAGVATLQVREAFLNGDGTKVGSHEEFILEDASVLISIALQHGIAIEDMRHSLGRDGNGTPATVIGAALEALAAIKAETHEIRAI